MFRVQKEAIARSMVGDQSLGNILVTWRVRCRTNATHIALAPLWAKEISIYGVVVSMALVSLLFC